VPDLRERFLELALRPLAGKSPAEDLARGELMERLNHSRPGAGDDSLESATARLEASSGGWLRNGWQALLLLLAFTTLLGAVSFSSWRDLIRLDHFYYILPGESTSHMAAERDLAAKVSEEDRLFLFSNSGTMGRELRRAWRERCKTSLPDDPGWLEEYAIGSAFDIPPSGDQSLRERILEQARRIDAGNGFWDLRDVNTCLHRFGFAYRTSKPGKGLGPAFPVLSTAEPYFEAVALLEKAAAAPRFESHIPPRSARRLAMLGPASDLAELADRNILAGSQQSQGAIFLRWRDLWEARAYELERAGDREGLRRWFETLERLKLRCLKESGDEQLQSVAILFMTDVRKSENFRNSLMSMNLYQEAARLDHWDREISGSLPVTVSDAEEFDLMGGAPVQGDWFIYGEKGLVTVSELEPSRRAERAMADRMLAVAAAALFGLLAWLAGLEGWRRAQPVGGLADGLGVLLRPSDFAWICGLGIALPGAWHVAVDDLSPLGWRDYSITVLNMKPIALRAAGSFLFATCMLVQTARWRLAKRGGLLGFRPMLWPGWVVTVTAALFVPAMGVVRYLTNGQQEFMAFGSAAAGVPLLWLLWRAFAMTLCPRGVALPGSMVCRMLVPSFTAASVFLLAAACLLHREESKWVKRDTLMHPDPGGSGMSVVEARWSKALREQLLHALETAPKAK
jgi:hypothetical protein